MINDTPQPPHHFTLKDRRHLSMTGVCEVVSFDENTVLLHTGLGKLMIQGRDLQLKTLTPEGGQVVVEGTITALVYEEPKPRSGWLGRLMG